MIKASKYVDLKNDTTQPNRNHGSQSSTSSHQLRGWMPWATWWKTCLQSRCRRWWRWAWKWNQVPRMMSCENTTSDVLSHHQLISLPLRRGIWIWNPKIWGFGRWLILRFFAGLFFCFKRRSFSGSVVWSIWANFLIATVFFSHRRLGILRNDGLLSLVIVDHAL